MGQIEEYFHLALQNLKSRSLRSWLTVLGIVIGVFLVITLISLSQGMEESVQEQLTMLGGNLIMVMPGGKIVDMASTLSGEGGLSDKNIETIKRVNGVEKVVVMPYDTEVVRFEGESKTTLISGMDWLEALDVVKEDMGYQLAQGNFPQPGRREALIGSLVSEETFPGIGVGDEFTIGGKKFKVSGVLMSTKNRIDDLRIILDLDEFFQITNKREGVPMAMVKPSSGFEVDEVAADIEAALEESVKRKIGEDKEVTKFTVLSSQTVSGIVDSIMGILQIVIIAFASIALVVGGIGITNTMFTSVRERTREIGTMKAVGAKNSAILIIFLIEAGIIGIIGGIGGTMLGTVFAKGVEAWSESALLRPITASVTPDLVIFGLVFSLIIGCLAGFFPAQSAAHLKPGEALRRHE